MDACCSSPCCGDATAAAAATAAVVELLEDAKSCKNRSAAGRNVTFLRFCNPESTQSGTRTISVSLDDDDDDDWIVLVSALLLYPTQS